MSDLMSRIADDIYEYEAACLVFGVEFDDDEVYSKKADKILQKYRKSKYNNRTHEYLRRLVHSGELPIKRSSV
jgi:hypothetical protein